MAPFPEQVEVQVSERGHEAVRVARRVDPPVRILDPELVAKNLRSIRKSGLKETGGMDEAHRPVLPSLRDDGEGPCARAPRTDHDAAGRGVRGAAGGRTPW